MILTNERAVLKLDFSKQFSEHELCRGCGLYFFPGNGTNFKYSNNRILGYTSGDYKTFLPEFHNEKNAFFSFLIMSKK